MKRVSLSLFPAALVGAALALAGCHAPQGSPGGRIDPYRTTSADVRSSRASIPAMLEFSDKVVESLAAKVIEDDDVRKSPTRIVMEVGSIENKTATPTGDFEMLQARVRGQILTSKLLKRYFMVVEQGAKMDAELARINGGSNDLLQDNANDSRTARYKPDTIYVLQGVFYEANRGERRQYLMNFKLVNLASREIVFNEDFDLAQVPY